MVGQPSIKKCVFVFLCYKSLKESIKKTINEPILQKMIKKDLIFH